MIGSWLTSLQPMVPVRVIVNSGALVGIRARADRVVVGHRLRHRSGRVGVDVLEGHARVDEVFGMAVTVPEPL